MMLIWCQHRIGLQMVGNDARFFGIPYMDYVRISDITFQKTVAGSKHNAWSTVTKKTECLAHTNYMQKRCFINGINFSAGVCSQYSGIARKSCQ